MTGTDDFPTRQRYQAAKRMVDALLKRRANATRELDAFAIDSMLDRARRALAVAEKDLKREGATP